MRHRLERSQSIQVGLTQTFNFFSDAANLEALTPPFLKFRILTRFPIEMRSGTRIEYTLSLFGIPIRWRTRITEWMPGQRFVDEQEIGPFAFWRHTHEFWFHDKATTIRDVVEYSEPFGMLGQLAHGLFVKRMLDRIFDFRHDQIQSLLNNVAPVRVDAQLSLIHI